MTSKTVYIDPQDFIPEIAAYQQALKEDPQEARLSERWGVLAIRLCDNMLLARAFKHYPFELKQDMKSFALQRLIRASQLVDLSKSPKEVFSYLCRAVHTSYVNIIMKEYSHIEKKNAWIHDELAKQGVSEAKIEELLGRKAGQRYTENAQKGAWYNHYRNASQRAQEASQQADVSTGIETREQERT